MCKRLIFSIAVILLACNIISCTREAQIQTDVSTDISQPQSTTEAEIKYTADYLPSKDYEGYEFRIITVQEGVYSLELKAAVENSDTSELVNDAIYTRNRIIEDKYNIKFKEITMDSYDKLTSTFKKSVTAGSDDFDLCMLINRDAFSLALENMLIPVDQLTYVDITQPWYAQQVNKEMTIGNKLYFAYSDECLNMFEWTLGVCFNKDLLAQLGLDNVYDLVQSGKWTLDKFFEMARASVSDLDGDGKMTDTDRYGIISEVDMLYPGLWMSSGMKMISKDKDDLPVFSVPGNDEFFNVLNKIYDYSFGGEKIIFDTMVDKPTSYPTTGGEDYRRVANVMFMNNLSLFKVSMIGQLQSMRDMTSDFGVVPLPKYNEEQKDYKSRVVDGWINTAPITTPDPERTSIIMEALAVESKNYTIPAYYEVALKNKYSRDPESKQMLDLIYDSRTMDIGDTFWMDPIRNIYQNQFSARKNDFASATEKAMPKVENAINKAIDAINSMS